MRNCWKEEQHPSFINFISTFLTANSFRLNFVPIAPVTPDSFFSHPSLCFNALKFDSERGIFLQDFIFNCGGLSVAFVFVTKWDHTNVAPTFSRSRRQLQNLSFLLRPQLLSYLELHVSLISHAESRNSSCSSRAFMSSSSSQPNTNLNHFSEPTSSELCIASIYFTMSLLLLAYTLRSNKRAFYKDYLYVISIWRFFLQIIDFDIINCYATIYFNDILAKTKFNYIIGCNDVFSKQDVLWFRESRVDVIAQY